jgi:hypothetical protein
MKPQIVLTELQKQQKQTRKTLSNLCEKILFQWSLKKITSWADVYHYTTTPPNPNPDPINFASLKAYLVQMQQELESSFHREIIVPTDKNKPYPPLISTDGKPTGLVVPPVEPATHSYVQSDIAEDLSSNNDYGLVSSPNEKAFFYWFQKKAIKESLDLITGRKVSAMLLLSATGTGKTFMVGGLVRRLYDMNFHEDKTAGVVYYLYVTRASIVEQTKRVFENTFNLRPQDGVEVLNIEQLRSRAGKLWINEKVRITNGEEEVYWEWRKFVNPVVVIWDECQALKNSGSTQSKIATALNNVSGVTQIFVSATPFTRVCEAKCFAVATHKDISNVMGIQGTHLTNENWSTYSSSDQIAGSQFSSEDYNEAAIERLTDDLESYIIRVKGVRPQFDANNKVEMIRFATPTERAFYEQAFERYQREKAKLEAASESGSGETGIKMLVEFLKFRMAAELCRAGWLAEHLHKGVTQDNKATVAALNFKGTIIEVVKILNEKYGVPRSLISLIWGGGQTALTAKQRAKAKIKAQADKLRDAGMDMDELMENLDLDEVEDRELQDLPEHLKLGTQSKEERQREIDKFQSGRSLYCLFTFRAGGVGLSLHHTDELCTDYNRNAPGFDEWEKKIAAINLKLPKERQIQRGKIRHKESGFGVEEDIPYVLTRSRRLYAAPTYSAMEIVQGLGRCPRLNSLSDSEQFLVFYTGTIEDDVAAIVSKKLRCLGKVVKTREKWADIITHNIAAKEHIENTKEDPTEPQQSIATMSTEDDNEE